MRIAFLLALAAYAVLVVVAAATLPERVPLHFATGGDADRWASRTEAIVTFALVGAGMALMLGGSAALVSRVSLRASWVNLPHKRWWTATPEREERARRRLRHDLYAIATGTMVLLVVVLALTIGAARSDDGRMPGGPAFPIAVVGAALVGALVLVIWMPMRYRPEAQS